MQVIRQIISHYRSKLAYGSFGHNVLVMFTGTMLGQLSTIILAPILTRIYTPEAFGIVGVFSSVIWILSVISALRYEMALPLAKSDEDAANLLAVCIAATIVTAFCSGVVIAMLPLAVLGTLAPYRWLLPVGFFCIGAYQVMVYYATRQGAFGIISRTKIYQGGAGPLSQIGLGLFGAGPWGLIIGFIVGQSTGIGLLFSRLVVTPHALRHISPAGMKAMAHRFRRFPLVSSWSGLLESAGTSYLLLSSIFYSSTIAGFIFLSERVIARPLFLVSTSILQVYIGEMSRSLNASDPAAVRHRFLQLAVRQLMIVAGWLLLVNALAPTLFPIIFGREWEAAVPYLQVLSIAYLPQMVMHALAHTLQIMERQGLSTAWEIGRLVAVIGAFVVSYALGLNALHALLVYSMVQALAQIILFLLMYQSIQSLQKGAPDVQIP